MKTKVFYLFLLLLIPGLGISQKKADKPVELGGNLVIQTSTGGFQVSASIIKQAGESIERFFNAAQLQDFEEFALVIHEQRFMDLGNDKISRGLIQAKELTERLEAPFQILGIREGLESKSGVEQINVLMLLNSNNLVQHTQLEDPITHMDITNKKQLCIIALVKGFRGGYKVYNFQEGDHWVW